MPKPKPVRLTAKEPEPPYRERIAEGKPVGQGGMGVVLTAFDRHLGREVALKRIAPHHRDHVAVELRQRLREEAQIMAQLDHPGIIPLYDIGSDDRGRLYFTMKLVQGSLLSEKIHAPLSRSDPHEAGPRPADRAARERRRIRELVQVVIRVCDALVFAHDRAVIHRDLKPQNVLLGDYGETYLMDWGISKLSRERAIDQLVPEVDRTYPFIEEKGRAYGSPGYMAPEQAAGQPDEVDVRTDVFGVGAILYEIVTKKAPFLGKNDLHSAALSLEARPVESLDQVPNLHGRLREIIATALQLKKEKRYQTMTELRRELASFLDCGWSFERVTFRRGQVIVEEGAPSDHAFIVVSGSCSAYKTVDGKLRHLRDMKAGDVFGETGIFAGTGRTARVKATTETVVAVLSREDLERDLRDGSWVSLLVTALAKRFVERDRRVTELERELERARLQLEKRR